MIQNRIITILGQKGSGKTTLAKARMVELTRLLVLDPNREYRAGVILNSYPALIELHKRNDKKQRYICRFESDDEIEDALEFVWEMQNFTLVAEEADLLCSPTSTSEMFSRIIRHGRHRAIDLYAISRRPAEISRLLTSQSDEIISFQQQEESDLDFLARRGFDREKLANLKQFEYISNSNLQLVQTTTKE